MREPSKAAAHQSAVKTDVDLDRLEGSTVLVRSLRDRRNPPTAMRGTLHVSHSADRTREAQVQIVLQYPQMFTSPAHERVVLLNDAEVERLLASERNGAYEFAIEDSLS